MRHLARWSNRALEILALPVVIVVVWWFASAASTSFYSPPLSQIVAAFGPTWFDGRIVQDVLPSLERMLMGFGISVVLGIALGIVIGTFRYVRETLEPLLEFLRAIPPPVLIPVIMIFAGIGNEMKVSVIVLGSIWPILLNTIEGVRGIDEGLRDTATVFQMSSRRRLVFLVLRGASPEIMVGARQTLSLAIILMVVSEMFAASNGIGFTVIQFQRTFQIPEMWTGIIVLGIIGAALSLIFSLIEGRVLRWYHGLRNLER